MGTDNNLFVCNRLIDETAVDEIQMSKSEKVTITVQDKKKSSLVPSGANVAYLPRMTLFLDLCIYGSHLLGIQVGKP